MGFAPDPLELFNDFPADQVLFAGCGNPVRRQLDAQFVGEDFFGTRPGGYFKVDDLDGVRQLQNFTLIVGFLDL